MGLSTELHADIGSGVFTQGGDEIIIEDKFGTGDNISYLVFDWKDGGPSVAFGYQWDGVKSTEDMFLGLTAATLASSTEETLYGHWTDFGPALGKFVDGIGYDADEDYNKASPPFGATGVVNTAGGVIPIDPGDKYVGNFTGKQFAWSLWVGDVNPFDNVGTNWQGSMTGVSTTPLVDDNWYGFSADSFSGSAPVLPQATAVPEPSGVALLGGLVVFAGLASRRYRQRRRSKKS